MRLLISDAFFFICVYMYGGLCMCLCVCTYRPVCLRVRMRVCAEACLINHTQYSDSIEKINQSISYQ